MKIKISDFQKINNFLWEIPQDVWSEMKVSSRVYLDREMLNKVFEDRSIQQLMNIAVLPGILKYSLAMPDIHEGYGFPIGGVAAFDLETGIISPGGVGYDINCGMRLLKSEYFENEIRPYLDRLAEEIKIQVPSGLGRGHKTKIDKSALDKILEGGSRFLVEKGFGEKEDFERCESGGCMDSADAAAVSEQAKNRGRDQVGTLGSGNHFLEIQKVEKIFDEKIAKTFGLFENQIVIMIHTGSRGLGHQIATDYLRLMVRSMAKYQIQVPDKELACLPFRSPEGQRYFQAMSAGANYAWANRQMITYYVRRSWQKILGKKNSLKILYDVAHNVAKIEHFLVEGKEIKAIVHRKGATRAFPPYHPEVPKIYQSVGQPILIPGSMGTSSYVLSGQKEGIQSWFSTCHGAGRVMSRQVAIRTISGRDVIRDLESKGIIIKCRSWRGIAEEAPKAYKNIERVVDIVCQSGLSRKVVRLRPLAVIKGE